MPFYNRANIFADYLKPGDGTPPVQKTPAAPQPKNIAQQVKELQDRMTLFRNIIQQGQIEKAPAEIDRFSYDIRRLIHLIVANQITLLQPQPGLNLFSQLHRLILQEHHGYLVIIQNALKYLMSGLPKGKTYTRFATDLTAAETICSTLTVIHNLLANVELKDLELQVIELNKLISVIDKYYSPEDEFDFPHYDLHLALKELIATREVKAEFVAWHIEALESKRKELVQRFNNAENLVNLLKNCDFVIIICQQLLCQIFDDLKSQLINLSNQADAHQALKQFFAKNQPVFKTSLDKILNILETIGGFLKNRQSPQASPEEKNSIATTIL